MPSVVYNVGGYVEISISQQFLTHNDERKRIMTFAARELCTILIQWFNLQDVHNINNTRP